jgi:hypothetical protein
VIRRLGLVALWLLVGHLAAFGLFWTLLQVPESSTLMLLASALLALGVALVTAAVQAGAVGAWNLELPFGRAAMAGARGAIFALFAAALFAAIWWMTGAMFEWHAARRGEIDAAAIAKTGSPNTAWLHFALHWLFQFVRWTLGLSLATALLGWLGRHGARSIGHGGWLRAALQPRRWVIITSWFVLLVVLPWSYVQWRPAGLSLGLEAWFVAAKLSLVATLMSIGWALVLREGQRP